MKRTILLTAVSALALVACGSDSAGDSDTTDPVATVAAEPEPDTTEPADTVAAEPEPEPAATAAPATAAPEPEPLPTEPVAAVGFQADLAITEVVFDDRVTITNLGSGLVDLDGLWLCNRPNYVPLPSTVLAPGESIDVSDFALSAGSGEAALYTSNSFGDSTQMVDYVAWGSGGGRGAVAADAGLWPSGDAVTTGATSISAPAGGSSSADWSES